MMAMPFVGTRVATAAPASAPAVVAISRNIAIRMFEKPSDTYAAAAPDEVAMTDTSDARNRVANIHTESEYRAVEQ